jgi:hypothetical protein
MNEIDEARRERDRARKAAERLRKGMVPQAERTVTKRLGEVADRSGVSLSTVKRHRRAGTLDRFENSVTQKCPDSLDQKRPQRSHREVMADLHAGARAAQDEWLSTLPLWSMT